MCGWSVYPVAIKRSEFGEPDRSFHGLDVAEERADGAERVVPPVLEQAGVTCHWFGLGRFRQAATWPRTS